MNQYALIVMTADKFLECTDKLESVRLITELIMQLHMIDYKFASALDKLRHTLEQRLRPPNKVREIKGDMLIVDPTQVRAARTWAFNRLQSGAS